MSVEIRVDVALHVDECTCYVFIPSGMPGNENMFTDFPWDTDM